MKMINILLFVIALLFNRAAVAQADPHSELFVALKKADSLVFDEGFNKCNFILLQQVMHPDLQFLHDQNGAQNREAFFKVFKESICSNSNAKPIRKLVAGSLIAYPLKNEGRLYGAVQMGMHEFYIAEPGKPLRFTGTAKFIHTWLLENGDWKLYRVISYDHQQPPKTD